jgi:hypothetical protein
MDNHPWQRIAIIRGVVRRAASASLRRDGSPAAASSGPAPTMKVTRCYEYQDKVDYLQRESSQQRDRYLEVPHLIRCSLHSRAATVRFYAEPVPVTVLVSPPARITGPTLPWLCDQACAASTGSKDIGDSSMRPKIETLLAVHKSPPRLELPTTCGASTLPKQAPWKRELQRYPILRPAVPHDLIARELVELRKLIQLQSSAASAGSRTAPISKGAENWWLARQPGCTIDALEVPHLIRCSLHSRAATFRCYAEPVPVTVLVSPPARITGPTLPWLCDQACKDIGDSSMRPKIETLLAVHKSPPRLELPTTSGASTLPKQAPWKRELQRYPILRPAVPHDLVSLYHRHYADICAAEYKQLAALFMQRICMCTLAAPAGVPNASVMVMPPGQLALRCRKQNVFRQTRSKQVLATHLLPWLCARYDLEYDIALATNVSGLGAPAIQHTSKDSSKSSCSAGVHTKLTAHSVGCRLEHERAGSRTLEQASCQTLTISLQRNDPFTACGPTPKIEVENNICTNQNENLTCTPAGDTAAALRHVTIVTAAELASVLASPHDHRRWQQFVSESNIADYDLQSLFCHFSATADDLIAPFGVQYSGTSQSNVSVARRQEQHLYSSKQRRGIKRRLQSATFADLDSFLTSLPKPQTTSQRGDNDPLDMVCEPLKSLATSICSSESAGTSILLLPALLESSLTSLCIFRFVSNGRKVVVVGDSATDLTRDYRLTQHMLRTSNGQQTCAMVKNFTDLRTAMKEHHLVMAAPTVIDLAIRHEAGFAAFFAKHVGKLVPASLLLCVACRLDHHDSLLHLALLHLLHAVCCVST